MRDAWYDAGMKATAVVSFGEVEVIAEIGIVNDGFDAYLIRLLNEQTRQRWFSYVAIGTGANLT